MSNETAPVNRIASPEDLAALIDGTLSPSERDRVLRVLAQSDEDLAELGEASAILQELQQGYRATPAARRRWERWSRWRTAFVVVPALAAAGVAGVLITRSEPRASSMVGLARAVPVGHTGPQSMADAFGADWVNPGWPEARGDGAVNRPSTRLFRMGVQLAKLEVAHSAADTSAMRLAVVALRTAAATTSARARVMAVEARGMPVAAADRTTLANALRVSEGAEIGVWFDLGVWCESARLTATNATPAATVFFRPSGIAMSTLDNLIEASQRNASGRGEHEDLIAALRVVAAHPVASASDVSSLSSLLNTAVQAGGR
ncbi:MAG: hypothetical protein JWM95_4275 [Gemmatimonadetes bacterium]|nr:hypothetical protein [Gemmatimonadota bacterium]